MCWFAPELTNSSNLPQAMSARWEVPAADRQRPIIVTWVVSIANNKKNDTPDAHAANMQQGAVKHSDV
jgi:hypothetical protein